MSKKNKSRKIENISTNISPKAMEIFIKQDVLNLILILAKNYYPNEFVALLRGDYEKNKSKEKITIRELLFVPGATFGDKFSSIDEFMIPFYKDIIGSVHSHPTRCLYPSNADLNFFKRYYVNLIVRFPYNCIEDIGCYDRNGKTLKVLVSFL